MMPVVFTMVSHILHFAEPVSQLFVVAGTHATEGYARRRLRVSDNSAIVPPHRYLMSITDTPSSDVYIIVTDMKRQEMDEVTEYFKFMCRYAFGRTCKPSMEQKIQYDRQ